MEKKSHLYKATNTITSQSYIGKSVDPLRRIIEHVHGYNKKSYIYSAIKKYGAENFLWEILESDVPPEKINEREILAIKKHGTKVPNGYNLTDGGEGQMGRIFSDETRRKISESKKGNTNNLGKKLTEEQKRKLSEALMGHRLSEETKRKISNSLKGKKYNKRTVSSLGL